MEVICTAGLQEHVHSYTHTHTCIYINMESSGHLLPAKYFFLNFFFVYHCEDLVPRLSFLDTASFNVLILASVAHK